MYKANEIAKWFHENNSSVQSMGFDPNAKLQKLVYYAQAMYSVVFGEPLFNEEVEGWPNGPVVRSVYHFKKKNQINNALLSNFDEDSLKVLQVVNSVYGRLTTDELITLTHKESPWGSREHMISRDHNPTIPLSEIVDFYQPLKEVFEAFVDYDFDNEVSERIGGNTFVYNKIDTSLEEEDYQQLFNLRNAVDPDDGSPIQNRTFSVMKEDGRLIVY